MSRCSRASRWVPGRPVAACILLALACACTGPGTPRGFPSAPRAISGGVPDPGHPAVGALILASGTCTAVQVAPRIVLTAAHCLQPGGPVGYVPGPSATGAQIDVVDWRAHPDHADHLENGKTVAWHDVGLVLLASDAPGPPLPRVGDLPSGFVGSTVTLVGFGETADGPPGTKQRADVVVAEVWSHGFWNLVDAGSPATACQGDSGGPSLILSEDGEAIVGVVSSGDAVCAAGAYHSRLDVDAEFLDEVLSEWEGADPDLADDAFDLPEPPDETDLAVVDAAELSREDGILPEDESPGEDLVAPPPEPPGDEGPISRDDIGAEAVPERVAEPSGSGGCSAGRAFPDPVSLGLPIGVCLVILARRRSRRTQSHRGDPAIS